MRQDQYVLRSAYRPAISMVRLTKSLNQINLDEHITINEEGEPVSDGLISFFNPHHICCLLNNYSKLKQESWGHFENDLYFLMEDLDDLIDKALENDYPVLYDILRYKIDGLQSKDII